MTARPTSDPAARGTLTSCPTDGPFGLDVAGFDPYAKDCPEDLPCRVQDPDLWFAEKPVELERAKAFCRECPARLACLAGACERREPWGVWGGEIFDRGAILAQKRPRGRPRKHEVAA